MTIPLADAEAVLIGLLAADDAAKAVLGVTADDMANVSAEDAPTGPWPACRVFSTPAGDEGTMRWLTDPEVQVEIWDAPLPGDQVGRAELRRRLYVLLGIIVDQPERTYSPGEPVITRVRSVVPGTYLPDPISGQPRWLANLRVALHPPAPE